MKKFSELRYFVSFGMLAGVLILGTPVYRIAAESEGETSYEETDHSEEGQISKPAYLENSNEESDWSVVDDSTDNTYGYYTIMGNTTVTLEDMTYHFNCQNIEYPSDALGPGGAATIEEFCSIILEEANAEGVRGEVVFEQSMLETGWLQFRGDSQVEQFNFAGLGTTGDGVQGIYFPDVRTGIRAQVQHLKAYACSEDLVLECVDERFDLVQRETAPYVEWLGIQENPYGAGWAAGEGYGVKLRCLLAELKGTEYEVPAAGTTENVENK